MLILYIINLLQDVEGYIVVCGTECIQDIIVYVLGASVNGKDSQVESRKAASGRPDQDCKKNYVRKVREAQRETTRFGGVNKVSELYYINKCSGRCRNRSGKMQSSVQYEIKKG